MLFSRQRSLVGSGSLDLFFLNRLGPIKTARCWDVRGVMQRATPAPRRSTLGTEGRPLQAGGTREAAGAHFLSGGPQARVARGGKERRPFRRVTAAESRWLTHRAPLPSWHGAARAWRTSGARDTAGGAFSPELGSLGHWAHKHWAGDTAVPTCLGLCERFPDDWVSTPRAQPQGLNPVLLPKHRVPFSDHSSHF